MKTINKIICTLLFIGVTSCNVDKITSLKDDFEITVTPDAIDNKKEIQINNATNSDPVPSAIIKMSISGDVASDIYTPDGSSSFVFDEGKIVIGLKKGMETSPENPIHADVTFEAEGYLSKTEILTFDGSGSESININLVKIDDLPETIQIEEETGALSDNETTTDIEVSITSANKTEKLAKILLEAGSSFEDNNGNPVNGSNLVMNIVTYELQTEIVDEQTGYSATEELANILLEAGSSFEDNNGNPVNGSNLVMNIVTYDLQTEIVDEQTGYSATEEFKEITIPASGDDEEAILEPFSVISLDTSLDGTPVNISEDTPATVNISVPNDEYEVYFVEKGSNTAIQITFKDKVANRSAGSSAIKQKQFKAYKTGLYFIAIKLYQSVFCSEDFTTLNFINNKAADRYRIILKEDGYIKKSSNVTLFNGEEIAIQFRPKKESLYTLSVIHNQKDFLSKNIVCGRIYPTFELGITETASYVIPMNINCPSISIALDETTIYYKSDGESEFYPYGKAVAGELNNTPKLEDNTDYQFQFFYDETITTDAILGSEIKELIDSYDLDEICDEIEAEI